MRFFTTLALASLLIGSAAQAQQITIAAARQAATGTSVTVGGRVQNGGELGPIRYIYDGTAAIGVYFSSTQAGSVLRGDSVTLTGVIAPYNNLMEISPVSVFNVVSNNNSLDTLVFASNAWSSAYAETYEGRLVRLNRLTSIASSTGTPITTFSAAAANYRLNNIPQLAARVNAASTGVDGILGKTSPKRHLRHRWHNEPV